TVRPTRFELFPGPFPRRNGSCQDVRSRFSRRRTMHIRSSSRTLAVSLALAGAASAQTVVNAPVAPDTIYVARNGPRPGVSVVDLNGFGAGTGDPTYDPTFATFTETS